MSERRIVILTDGRTNPMNAKTASCVVRYKPEEVVALLDTTQPGKTSQELLGVGGAIPVVAKLADAPGANTLLIGIAPSGGKLPPAWRKILLEAIDRGMNLVSGLHDFLSNDPEIAAAAAKRGVRDSRRPQEQRARRLQSPEPARRLPADSHRRPGLLGRQDAGRRSRSRSASRRAATMRSSSPPARPAS